MKNLAAAFTSTYWTKNYFAPNEHCDSLLRTLLRDLPHIDPASWPLRFSLGGVYVNGLPASEDMELPTPCKIEYYEPKFPVEEAARYFPQFSRNQVLYEDEDLLVVFKPAGISSMPARDQNVFHLKAQIENYLERRIHMPSRIDMSTQGLVIVSASERMHRHLQHIFQFRRIEKTYIFCSDTTPSWPDHLLDMPIGRDPAHPVLRTVNGTHAREARTHFRVLGQLPDGAAALEAKPLTGRTHQIRVHAAHLGVPVRGDKFYGGAAAPVLQLLSYRAKFMHPLRREILDIKVPSGLLPDWVKEIEHLL